MLTDPLLSLLWCWALAKMPVAALLMAMDTLPSHRSHRVRA